MKKWKVLTAAGLILWGVLIGASRVHAEEVVEIPEEIQFWCEKYGKEYDICPEVIEAMCWVESRCQTTAQSPDKACKGLLQVKPACHQARMERLGVRNIFGTWENLKVGADYLAELKEDEEDIAVALARYNGQSADKIEKTRQGEYSGYVKKVLDIASDLERRNKK